MSKGEVTVRELSRTQQALVRRVAEAKATVPEFTLSVDADVTATVAALDDIPLEAAVVRAAALALRDVPRANGAYRDGRWELYERVNIAVSVFTEDGVVAPVVADADTKPVAEIAAESHALAERVRSGAITSPELASATFTVSTLQSVDAFTAILVPPQAAALAVGRRTVSLTADARILSGDVAGAFLRRIADGLADPAALDL